jgi:hypothetical protein
VRLGGKNCPSIRKQPNSLPMHIKSDHEAQDQDYRSQSA